MDALSPFKYTFIAIPVFARVGNHALHHYGMGLEQVLFRKRVQRRVQFVCPQGVLHFQDFACRGHNPLAFDDVGYLIFGKHVAFYRQGTVDALNLVDPAQAQTIRLFQPDGKPFGLGRNLCCKVDYRRVERKGRLVFIRHFHGHLIRH